MNMHCAVLCLLLLMICLPAHAGFKDDSVLLRVRVSTDYPGTEEDLNLLSKLADFLAPRRQLISGNESLSQLILNEYGIAEGEHPGTYNFILSWILKKNNIANADLVLEGQELSIPNLPRIAPTHPRRNPFHAIPAIRKLDLSSALAFTTMPKRSQDSRKGTQTDDLEVLTSREKLSTSSGQALLNLSENITLYESMIVQWADNDAGLSASHSVFKPTQSDKVRKLLASPKKRPVLVIVLDSGWPIKAYSRSIRIIEELFASARSQWNFPGTSINIKSTVDKPKNPHCERIETALEEMTILDTSSMIPVAFFPMTKEQGAEPILRELLRLHYKHDKTLDPLPTADLPADIETNADKYASDVLKHVADTAEGQEVKTSKALLDALFEVADAWASSTGGIYFVNTSWTVKQNILKIAFPEYGLPVVAAGNEPGKDITSDEFGLDLARRCVKKEVLTVMNLVDGAGSGCSTSIVNKDFLDEEMVVAFDGMIPEDCGTSFATPRVAWLLALSEAQRSYEVGRNLWIIDLFRRLKSIRTNDLGFRKVMLDPDTILQASGIISP
jgi:hypothetical protein